MQVKDTAAAVAVAAYEAVSNLLSKRSGISELKYIDPSCVVRSRTLHNKMNVCEGMVKKFYGQEMCHQKKI